MAKAKKKDAQPDTYQCLGCKKKESPTNPGGLFTSNGDNGMIITFWLCESCAIPLGPSQGPIDMEDPTTRV